MSDCLERFQSNQRMSQLIKLHNYIETSGIVAECDEQDITSQTKSVLEQLEVRLQSVGADRNHLIRIQIWLTNMEDFEAMNRVYDQWFEGFYKPTRACVGAQLADPHYRIEIQASAVL